MSFLVESLFKRYVYYQKRVSDGNWKSSCPGGVERDFAHPPLSGYPFAQQTKRIHEF